MEERRKDHRIEWREPVEYQLNEDPRSGGCLACDLSEGGLKMNSSQFLPLNSRMRVNLRVMAETIINLPGKVVWVQQLPYSERYQVGVEFAEEDLNPKAKEEIRQYIRSRRY